LAATMAARAACQITTADAKYFAKHARMAANPNFAKDPI